MKKMYRVAALTCAAALTLAACGSPDDDEPGATPTSGGASPTAAATTPAPTEAKFTACMVSDSGGIDDRSFNASAWKGVEDAATELGIEKKFLESKNENDFTPNINALVKEDCGIIVTVGFLMGDATKDAATKNADEKFAIVDFGYEAPIPNVKPLIFDTAQASFLAGYLAAGMTKTGKVATYGGMKIPTVTIFMDGFAEGVAYYNEKKGKSVKVLGWDEAKQNGSFTGDFQNQNKGKQLTDNFVQQGADIVLPVAGPVGLGTVASAKASGGKLMVIWVDTDGCVSDEKDCSVFLSSVVKGIDVAVKAAIKDTKDGAYNSEPFVGTLANEGVSLAPFHEFDSKVSAELKAELDQVKADISAGTIKIKSPSSPK